MTWCLACIAKEPTRHEFRKGDMIYAERLVNTAGAG